MSDALLRKQLIRLAHANPEMRPYILPVLASDQVGMEFPTMEGLKKYLGLHPGADKSKHTVVKKKDEKLEQWSKDNLKKMIKEDKDRLEQGVAKDREERKKNEPPEEKHYTDEEGRILVRHPDGRSPYGNEPNREYQPTQKDLDALKEMGTMASRMAREFPTPEARKKYLEEHPKAEPSNHTVKGEGGDEGGKEDKPKDKDKDKKKDEDKPEGKSKKKDEGGGDSKVKVTIDEERLNEVQPKIDDEFSEYAVNADADDVAPEHREQLLKAEYKLEIVGTSARQALAIAQRMQANIQAGADYCDVNPPACKGNKDLSRDKMPQIESGASAKSMIAEMPDDDEFKSLSEKVREAQKEAVEKGTEKKLMLKSIIPDGKKREAWLSRSKGEAMVQAGADPNSDDSTLKQMIKHFSDNGVKTSESTIPVGMLKATQNEIQADKAYGMASGHLKQKDHKGKPFDITKGDPIIVSKDGHILDGHHRWAAMLLLNPKMDLKVKVIDMDMDDLLKESQAVGGVYKADFAGIPLPEEDQKKYKTDAASKFKKSKKPKGKGKKGSLRTAAIHLAHANPSLRPFLLPLL